MAFIEGKPNPNLGEQVGAGLASGLEQLMQIKMNHVLQRHERDRVAQAYGKIPGITPEQGHILANMPEQHRMDILRELAMRNQEDQWRNQQMEQPQGQQYQGMQPQQQQQSGFQNFMGQRQAQPQGFQPQGYGMQQPMNGQPGRIPFQNPQLQWQQQKYQMQLAENQRKEQKSTQQNIERRADKFIDQAVANAGEAEQLKSMILRAKELIATGKTRAGVQGLLSSKFTNANAETRELEKLFSEMILLRGNMGKGVPSRMKLQLAREAKASLDQPKPAQLYILDNMLEDAEKTINAVGIIDEIIDANGSEVPKGLNRLATQVYHNRYSGKSGQNAQQAMGQQRNIPQDQARVNSPQIDTNTSASNGYDDSEENALAQAIRLGVGGATRVASGLITGPGDIVGMGASAADYAGKVIGKDFGASEAVKKYSPLPTSEGVAKKISEFTKGYTDPKGAFEDFGYRVLDTFGSFFMPQKAIGKVAQLLGKAGVSTEKAQKAENIILPFSGYAGSKKRLLGQATAFHAVGDIASGLGADPLLKTVLQTGAFILTGTAGTRKALEESAKEDFKNSRDGFGGGTPSNPSPSKAFVETETALKKMYTLRTEIENSVRPYKEQELKIIDDAINALDSNPILDIKGKRFPRGAASGIVKQIEDINQHYRLSTEQRVAHEKITSKSTRDILHEMKNILEEPLRQLEGNPEFKEAFDSYLRGKDKWVGLNEHGKITKWMIDNAEKFGDIPRESTMSHAIFNVLKGTAAFAGRDIAKVIELCRTTQGRAAYLEAINSASAGNIPRFKNAFKKMLAIAKRENIQ